MADYFEIGVETIQKQYQRNRDEFDSDGTHIKTSTDFKSLSWTKCPTLKVAQQRGFIELTLPNNTTVLIPNGKIRCFPKRAILRMGMLLRDSVVAKEVRTQLLNTFENTTDKQRTAEIDKERELRDNIWDAWGADEIDEVMKASAALDEYRRRYITSLEKENADLTKQNAKVVSENKALTAENDIYARDVLKWTDRSSANRAVRVLATMCFKGDFEYAWNTIYKELNYRYNIGVKTRQAADKRKRSKISYIKDSEWIYLFRIIAALCNKNNINIKELFEDAKIDISDLDLPDRAVAHVFSA